ncbi:hypothetical protein ACFW04_006627 [Cataglyphis niger]
MSYCYLIQGKCLTLRNEFPYDYVCEFSCKPVCTPSSLPCEVPCDPCGTPCPPITLSCPFNSETMYHGAISQSNVRKKKKKKKTN